MNFAVKITICFYFLLSSLCSNGNVKPNSLFSDHMILQKGVSVPVWGTADEGELITVQFNGQTATTVTKNGKWVLKLQPLSYATIPASLVISGKNTVVINDVLVGEVWICSGQSNMERQLGPRPPQPLITDWEKERDAAVFPLIREYYVPLKYSSEKLTDRDSKWVVCSPQTVSDFSAVGYFFAKNLFAKLNVPVAIIFSAFGGTPAEDWTSKEALQSNPELEEFVKNYQKIVTADYQPAGQLMSGLYNGMVYPLIPYAIAGVAWYQGEANNGRTGTYREVLTNMINNWRKDFGQGDFPFLIVQIAPHKDMSPELREAQLLVSKTVKHTALIVITDCGAGNEIHPPNKQPVGERLAIAARAIAYGEKIEYTGPQLKSYIIKGDKIILHFSHTGKGLRTNDNDSLRGFLIAADDKIFRKATAVIKKKNKVIVYQNAVVKPIAVRYGWNNVPDVNLCNSEGLPASPFRTDPN